MFFLMWLWIYLLTDLVPKSHILADSLLHLPVLAENLLNLPVLADSSPLIPVDGEEEVVDTDGDGIPLRGVETARAETFPCGQQ